MPRDLKMIGIFYLSYNINCGDGWGEKVAISIPEKIGKDFKEEVSFKSGLEE
jgi:hypothetical protein